MSRAEELLNSLGTGDLGVMTLRSAAPTAVEEHIIIDSYRYVSVPESLKRIAVQFDHDIETVTFDCPRYWDGRDLSEMKIYINYMRADNYVGSYLTPGATIDSSDSTIMHFDWVISQNVTAMQGGLSFLVCIKRVDSDGNEEQHWNSELNQEMYISKGIESSDTVVNLHPDVIASLLARTDYVEGLVKPEVLAGYVNYYLNNNPAVVKAALDTMVTPEALEGYVNDYLDEHPIEVVEVDDTLTKTGAAADARQVGLKFDAQERSYTLLLYSIERLMTQSVWLVPLSSELITFDTPDANTSNHDILFDLPYLIDTNLFHYRFEIEVYGLQKYGNTLLSTSIATIELVKDDDETSGVKIVELKTTEPKQTNHLTDPGYFRTTIQIMPPTNAKYVKNEGWYRGELLTEFDCVIHKDADFVDATYDRVRLRLNIGSTKDNGIMPVETFGIRFSYYITGEKEGDES